MWKWGLWPRNSFSGNICFEFSEWVLCSVALKLFVLYTILEKLYFFRIRLVSVHQNKNIKKINSVCTQRDKKTKETQK
jgi:hypothetical protein